MFKPKKIAWGCSEEGQVSKKKGFTLAEILSVAVILAVLAAVAIPGFSKSKAKAEANQAIAYLRTIRTAERMYFAKNNEYSCQAAGSCDTVDEIKAVLGAEVGMNNIYTFNVTATATTFTAMARKGSTAPAACTDSNTICIDQSGTWSGTSTLRPTVADV